MRIIAGQHKGRGLLSPKGLTTRPITGRVKAALFNILGEGIQGAVVVDLFCGTGSLGLEALSRGASFCYFAERDRLAVARLRRNVQAMRLADRCRIWRGDVLRHLLGWVEELTEPVHVAFVDPPFSLSRTWHWDSAAEKLFEPLAGKLAADGLVVFRCPRKIDLPDAFGTLCVRRRRDYGKMSLLFLARPGT